VTDRGNEKDAKKTDWNALIPELRSWNNGDGIDPEGWIACAGNFELAIGYTTLFWPDFIRYDDMVFIGSEIDDDGIANINSWLESHSGDKTRTEMVINHIHLIETHFSGCPGATAEKLHYLGVKLKEMWTAKLAQDFPGETFSVSLFGDPSVELSDCQITFHRIRE
jgi:hypothetical protein